MRVLYGRQLRELAEKVEKEFFRIERESFWRSGLINGLIAGTAVGLVAWAVAAIEQNYFEIDQNELLLFACLGSSAASVVFAPLQKTNSLRSITIAYTLAALVCMLLFGLRDYLGNDERYFPIPVQCALAVALSISCMRWAQAMHPAAVGSGMAFVIFHREVLSLLLLMLAVVVLIFTVKIFAYIYLEELTFKNFWREFTRNYYGKEMRVSVDKQGAEEEITVTSDPQSNQD